MEKVHKEALTFDDVLVIPMHSDVLPKEVSLKTKFTKNERIRRDDAFFNTFSDFFGQK